MRAHVLAQDTLFERFCPHHHDHEMSQAVVVAALGD